MYFAFLHLPCDWAKLSLNGRTQMVATNMTGIVVAVIIFSSCKISVFIVENIAYGYN